MSGVGGLGELDAGRLRQGGEARQAQRTPMVAVDALRHCLTLAVIFQHMPSRTSYSDATNAAMAHWVPLVDGAVACFFLLSGYFSRPGMTRERIIQMARRLLIPYFLFCLAYAVLLVGLGKIDVSTAIVRTVTFAGVGPQLYFLPYLFLVSLVVTVAIDRIAPEHGRAATRVLILLFFLAYLALPTANSTGPAVRLLALYGLAYTVGVYRARYAGNVECLAAVLIALAALALIPWTRREWDLALIVLVSEAALRSSAWISRAVRLPGSGGVYLLHTPILNYAIAMVLLRLGIREFANVFLALALTYIVALGLTLVTIRVLPRLRPYLLE